MEDLTYNYGGSRDAWLEFVEFVEQVQKEYLVPEGEPVIMDGIIMVGEGIKCAFPQFLEKTEMYAVGLNPETAYAENIRFLEEAFIGVVEASAITEVVQELKIDLDEEPNYGEEFPFDEFDRAVHVNLKEKITFRAKHTAIRHPVKHKKPHMNRKAMKR